MATMLRVAFFCLAATAALAQGEDGMLSAEEAAAQAADEEEQIRWEEEQRAKMAAEQQQQEPEQQQQQDMDSFEAPERFQIVLETDILTGGGRFTIVKINVTSQFAPVGAARLYQMVKDGAWDRAPFYRVDPDFVIQFGIPGVPEQAAKWAEPVIDDPVEVSNQEGTFVMVHNGADTRNQQVFINLSDNTELDEQNYAPLGQVVEGLEDLRTFIYNPTEGRPGGCDQQLLAQNGVDWLRSKVPRINQINRAYIIES